MEELLELLVAHKRITFEMMPGGTYRVTVGRPGVQSSGHGPTMSAAMGQALQRSLDYSDWPEE